MLRISPAPAGDPPAAPACPSAPALPTVTVEPAAPAAGATATLTATVPAAAGAATYQWQRDVGGVWTPVGAAGAHLPGARLHGPDRDLAGAGALHLGGQRPTRRR